MKLSIIIASLFLVWGMVSVAGQNGELSSEGEFIVNSNYFDEKGVLSLSLSFKFDEDKVLYDWYGHIYPLYKYGLFCEAEADSGEKLKIVTVEKVLPKLLYPEDTVLARDFKYQKPLLLKITRENGEPFLGCLEFSLIYNTNELGPTESELSLLNLKSNKIKICNKKENGKLRDVR